MPAAVWKNLQCLQSVDEEIVLAFLHASIFFIGCLIFALEHVWRRFFARCALHFAGKLFLCVLELLELGARFALHMPGKNYIMEKWTKKSESTNT